MALKDKDIRESLFLFLEEQYGRVRFIEEKNVGRSRADVLMVTEDALIGVEIKSDADTYQRLKSQVKDYDRFCDMNYVAVGSSHAMHIEEHIPDYWGIIRSMRSTVPRITISCAARSKTRNAEKSRRSGCCGGGNWHIYRN